MFNSNCVVFHLQIIVSGGWFLAPNSICNWCWLYVKTGNNIVWSHVCV